VAPNEMLRGATMLWKKTMFVQ